MPRQLEPDAREELRECMLTRMQERTADEWMALFLENGNIAAEPFDTAQAALDHPDMVANGEVVTVEDRELGPPLAGCPAPTRRTRTRTLQW